MQVKHVLMGVGVLLFLIVFAFMVLMLLFLFTPDSTTAIQTTTSAATSPHISTNFFTLL